MSRTDAPHPSAVSTEPWWLERELARIDAAREANRAAYRKLLRGPEPVWPVALIVATGATILFAGGALAAWLNLI